VPSPDRPGPAPRRVVAPTRPVAPAPGGEPSALPG